MQSINGEKKYCTAIVLAGGQGTRMGSKVQKQYLRLGKYPVLFYSLHVFEQSGIIDEVILVAGAGQTDYVRREIVERYGFTKVSRIVEGGKERYHSVWEGLKACRDGCCGDDGYIFIHDSARPFVTEEILGRAYKDVERYGACVAGMPSKDTVKLVNPDLSAKETPDRNCVWIIQTPQVFRASVIIEAYSKMMGKKEIHATDDAMAVENETGLSVYMTEGSYENIKITTPEDLDIAEVLVQRCFPEL